LPCTINLGRLIWSCQAMSPKPPDVKYYEYLQLDKLLDSQRKYSNLAVETALAFRMVFHFPWMSRYKTIIGPMVRTRTLQGHRLMISRI
jgi:hypothetical protein